MERLSIDRTRTTPAVDCDPVSGQARLSGTSYPENPREFFRPLFDWLERYFAAGTEPLAMVLELVYFNTSSSKCILDLLDLLEEQHQHGAEIRVEWRHEADDEDMAETGEEFREDFGLPFEIVSVEAI